MRLVIRFVARVACAALTLALLPRVGATQSGLSDAERRLARDIFRELIEINTTDSLGNTPRAARAMARRLVAAGVPAADGPGLIGPDPRHGHPGPRYRAAGSCIQWLVTAHRDLINAEFALNTDAGGGILRDGKAVTFEVQASEKVYATYVLEATDKGGHSSLPRPADNPIYRIAGALDRLAPFSFPVKLNEVSRAYFERAAALEAGSLADDMRGVLRDPPDSAAVARLAAVPFYNSKLRTTCVATVLAAGHAENALPQSAQATVNCRILPDQAPAEVEATLRRVVADDRIAMRTTYAPIPSPPSPLTPAIMGPIERLVAEQFPGVPVVPVMGAGATDGLFLRNAGIPSYGVSAVFDDPNDIRAHGRDERIRVQSFYDALEFWYRMMQAFSSP